MGNYLFRGLIPTPFLPSFITRPLLCFFLNLICVTLKQYKFTVYFMWQLVAADEVAVGLFFLGFGSKS